MLRKLLIALLTGIIVFCLLQACVLEKKHSNIVGSSENKSPATSKITTQAHLINTTCVGSEVVVLVNFENVEAYPMELTITINDDTRVVNLEPGHTTGEMEYPLGVSYTPGHAVHLDYKWINAPYEHKTNRLELLWPETNCEQKTTTTSVAESNVFPEVKLGPSQTLVCTPEVNAVTPCGTTTTTTILPKNNGTAPVAFSDWSTTSGYIQS